MFSEKEIHIKLMNYNFQPTRMANIKNNDKEGEELKQLLARKCRN